MLIKKNPVWSFFSSVKLTIALLMIIALASILGTFIPQQEASEIFAGRLSPGMASVFEKLQLFDVYHSVWFLALMALLSVNLIVCSLNRLPVSWRRFRNISASDETDVFRNLPSNRVIPVEGDLELQTTRVEGLLKKRYKRVRRKEAGQSCFLRGEKGNFSYFAVYLIHVSVLIILTGAIIGFFFGYHAYVEVVEGEAADTIQLQGGKGSKKLDFTIRCDRFLIEYYQDGTPKRYLSDLAFLRNEQVVFQGPVLVNHPVTFEGIRFYQASYGSTPAGEAVVMFRKGRGQAQAVKAAIGKTFDLPGKEGTITLVRMEENFMRMGPAIKIDIQSAKDHVQFWVFQNIDQIKEMNPGITDRVPMFDPERFAPYVFSLTGIQMKYYTGLQVNKDPGVPIAVAGAFLLVAGFMMVFFYAHRQVWIRLDRHGTGTRISVTGKTNKDRVGLEREMGRLIGEIKKTGGPGS